MEGATGGRPRRVGLRGRWARRFGLTNIAASVYGLILMLALLVVNAATAKNLTQVAVTLLVTGFVFWVAHVYANILEAHTRVRRRLTRAEVRAELDEEWPLVGVGIPPVLVILVADLLHADRATAIWLAMILCLVELVVIGVVMARRSGYGWRATTVIALLNLGFGLLIVALKVFVH